MWRSGCVTGDITHRLRYVSPPCFHFSISPSLLFLSSSKLTTTMTSSTPIPTPQNTFHLFPHLLSELRNTIWTHALTSHTQILPFHFNISIQQLPPLPE